MKYIIEGIDRLGKSTLTEEIQKLRGYHLVIHYDKPKDIEDYYNGDLNKRLEKYQFDVNRNMFDLIGSSNADIIFDRGHLGECVYAPMYRGYDGDYVFDLESRVRTNDTKLILLTTSNFDICVDDGESFNFENKEVEQKLFINAFNQSNMNKVLIDVYDSETGTFKDPLKILKEALF